MFSFFYLDYNRVFQFGGDGTITFVLDLGHYWTNGLTVWRHKGQA